MNGNMTVTASKVMLAVAAGGLSAWFGSVWPLLIMVIIALGMDFLTGVLAAAYEGELASSKGWKGIAKKIGYLLLFTLGLGLDAAIPYLLERGLTLSIDINLPFGLILAAWIVLTEALSIIENLYRLGVEMPAWLVKILRIARDNANKTEEK